MTRRAAALVLPLLFTGLAACSGGGAESETTADGAPGSIAVPTGNAAAANPDARELSRYRLTMDDLRKWSDIQKAVKARGIEEEESESESAEMEDDGSLDALEARLEASPKLRAVIEEHGLDARKFAVITHTVIQAGMINYAMSQGVNGDSLARAMQVEMENVKFLKDHEKEVAALRVN